MKSPNITFEHVTLPFNKDQSRGSPIDLYDTVLSGVQFSVDLWDIA